MNETAERLMDLARTVLFPLYSSLLTPVWLRALEASNASGCVRRDIASEIAISRATVLARVSGAVV